MIKSRKLLIINNITKYFNIYYAYFQIFTSFVMYYDDFYKNSSAGKSYTLNIYCITKAFKIMTLLKKMHEDVQFDFADDIAETGRLFGDNPLLMNVAKHNGFDVNWLIMNDIPDHIDKIEKDLRQRGYLK